MKRGIENGHSPLEVVLAYEGTESEESLSSFINSQGLYIGGVKMEIMPIREAETGSLADFLIKEDSLLGEDSSGRKDHGKPKTQKRREYFSRVGK